MTDQKTDAAVAAQNVQIVEATLEALNRGDIDALLACFAEDIHVLDEANQVAVKGCEQYRDWITTYLDAWEYYREFPEQLTPAGDRVVVLVRSEGRGAGSGVPVVERHGEIYTLRERRIVDVVIYPTFAEAVEAAGLATDT